MKVVFQSKVDEAESNEGWAFSDFRIHASADPNSEWEAALGGLPVHGR